MQKKKRSGKKKKTRGGGIVFYNNNAIKKKKKNSGLAKGSQWEIRAKPHYLRENERPQETKNESENAEP